MVAFQCSRDSPCEAARHRVTRSSVAIGAILFFAAATTAGKPVITRQPADLTVISGRNATFDVVATGTGALTYQWQRSGSNLFGATSETFVIGKAGRADAGMYSVAVTDSTGTTISDGARLWVAPTGYPTTIIGVANPDLRLLSPATGRATAVLPMSDNGFIAGGEFRQVNGTYCSLLIRVNADGSLNTSFAPPDILGEKVTGIARQADGKVVFVGDFNKVGGFDRSLIARLNADGGLDEGFKPELRPASIATGIAIQTDGKLVVATEGGGSHLQRLNPDGSYDIDLLATSDSINAFVIQTDGRILVATSGNSSRLVRLNSDGTPDPTFGPGDVAGNITELALQSDGKIIIGGSITKIGESDVTAIARLNADGSRDPAFAPTISTLQSLTPAAANSGSLISPNLSALCAQTDGKIVIAGNYFSINGTNSYSNIARLNSDGTPDRSWSTDIFPNLSGLVQMNNGDIVGVAGSYDELGTYNGLIRFRPSGTVDPLLNLKLRGAGQVTCLLKLHSGGTLVIGQFDRAADFASSGIIRLTADGRLDRSFHISEGAPDDYSSTTGAVELPDGRVAIVGNFTTFAGMPRNGCALLRPDGTLDPTFVPVRSAVASPAAIAITFDGKLIIAGSGPFLPTQQASGGGFIGTAAGAIAEYNTDGSLASAFKGGDAFDSRVEAVLPLGDGSVIVGGEFTTFDGTPAKFLAHLKADGSLDTEFASNCKIASWVGAILAAPSGEFLVSGDWSSGGTLDDPTLMNPDGTRDTRFTSACLDRPEGLLMQEDGKVIVATRHIDGSGEIFPERLQRLNTDGSLDPSFQCVGVDFPVFEGRVSMTMGDDGSLIVAGTAVGSPQIYTTKASGKPVLTSLPVPQRAGPGSSATFTVQDSSDLPVSYQWLFNGISIPGATGASYTVSGFTAEDAGLYSVTATNEFGSVTTVPVALSAPADNQGRLINLSVRTSAGGGADTLIVGYVLGGENAGGNKALLLRGVGPTLKKFGITGFLPDPMVEVFDATNAIVDENDDWTGVFDFATVGAFPYDGEPPKDAAVYNPYATVGLQSMHVIGKDGESGIALAEVYDATPSDEFTTMTPRLINGSARAFVGNGNNVLILGFSIGGESSVRLLIRGVGPTVGQAPFNVSGTLADPVVEVYGAGQEKIAENDNWADGGSASTMNSMFDSVGAFRFSSESSKDSAVSVTLDPGVYSAVVRGKQDATGVALVELYVLPLSH